MRAEQLQLGGGEHERYRERVVRAPMTTATRARRHAHERAHLGHHRAAPRRVVGGWQRGGWLPVRRVAPSGWLAGWRMAGSVAGGSPAWRVARSVAGGLPSGGWLAAWLVARRVAGGSQGGSQGGGWLAYWRVARRLDTRRVAGRVIPARWLAAWRAERLAEHWTGGAGVLPRYAIHEQRGYARAGADLSSRLGPS